MKWIGRLIGISVIMSSPLVGSEARAQDAGNPRAGFILAQQICSQCHAIEKTQTRSPNTAAPSFEAIASVPGMTATALAAALQTSHQTMPNVMLNASELSDITAYILGLRRAN